MNTPKHILTSSLVALLLVSSAANAFLAGRDLDGDMSTNEAYYDTDSNLTWLADANYAKTSGYDADGLMNWRDSKYWAQTLNYGGYTGWVLFDPNIQCLNSHFCFYGDGGSLYFNALGNLYIDAAGDVIPVSERTHYTGPFENVAFDPYWTSSTIGITRSDTDIITFSMLDGYQGISNMLDEHYAWAIHNGDIGVATIPVPAAAWLFGSGLLTLLGLSRQKART